MTDQNREKEEEVYKMPNQYCYLGMYLNAQFHPKEHMDKVRKIKITPEDILLATYPRTGTTLTGNIISLILSEEKDLSVVTSVPLTQRNWFLERLEGDDRIDEFTQFKGRRVVKTHMAYQGCDYWVEDCQAKTIVCTRNPKDGLESLYDFFKGVIDFGYFTGTWNEFFKMHQSGLVYYGDCVDWIVSWLKQIHRQNVYLVYYEDIVRNPQQAIKKIAEFLGRSLTQSRIGEIAKLVSLKSMQKQINTKPYEGFKESFKFVRKGEVGGWKNCFTVAQNEWMDRQIVEKTKGYDLKWTFE